MYCYQKYKFYSHKTQYSKYWNETIINLNKFDQSSAEHKYIRSSDQAWAERLYIEIEDTVIEDRFRKQIKRLHYRPAEAGPFYEIVN